MLAFNRHVKITTIRDPWAKQNMMKNEWNFVTVEASTKNLMNGTMKIGKNEANDDLRAFRGRRRSSF